MPFTKIKVPLFSKHHLGCLRKGVEIKRRFQKDIVQWNDDYTENEMPKLDDMIRQGVMRM